ncbi:lytic transglycosylase domain-containing protein [Persephonella sp.]
MAIILSVLFIFSFTYGIEDCVSLFNKEKFFQSERCFKNVKKGDVFYPYSVYYLNLISILNDDLDEKLESEILKLNDFAVSHYGYLVLGRYYLKKDPKKALIFIESVDEKALKKEDLPFFIYLKSEIYEILGNRELSFKLKKKLALNYTFDRYYGYSTLMSIINKLSEKEIYKAVDTLSSYRMFDRALKVLSFVDYSDRYLYYKMVLNLKKRNYKEGMRYFYTIGKKSKWYPRAVYSVILYNRKYDVQKRFFKKLINTNKKKFINRAAHRLMKKSFYRQNYEDMKFFSRYIDKDFRFYSDKIWFLFLAEYRKGNFKKGAEILEKNLNLFSNKGKIYYWLYLSYKDIDKDKSFYYLKKAGSIKGNDFYSLWAKKKLGISKVSLKVTSKLNIKYDKKIKLLKGLRESGLYKEGYLEGMYILRRNKNNLESMFSLYSVYPELTARYFARIKKYYKFSFPKPFPEKTNSNLVYSIMRQESFFDPYAVSRSNAVGLMQIIPPTGKWIAEKLKVKGFDVTHLFDINTNIKFGEWYINYLIKKFKGNLFHGIASYNGGEVIVKKVLKNNTFRDIAEFIEYIPYNETRNYVKKVYRNFIIYNQYYPQ